MMLKRSFFPVVLTHCVLMTAFAQSSPIVSQSDIRKPERFKIVLVGDSTVATEGGWGPAFCATLTPNVTCVDTAKNGRSSKSFLAEGLWSKALEEKGRYYFIQFGHNDGKPDLARRTDPETAFADNLRRYIRETRAIGAIPILVSPLSRRNYKDGKLIVDDLKEYATAMHHVADQEQVTFIDLYAMSTHLLEGMTQEQADAFDAATIQMLPLRTPVPQSPTELT